MPQAYCDLVTHFIFSTKDRLPQITPDIRERLCAYMAGIARNHNAVIIEIGGVEDHVHILARLHTTIAPATFLREVKSNSSRWVHDELGRPFGWQTGAGSFSVSRSNVESVREYIRGQEEHHRRTDFKTEFRAFLERHGIEYDERYIWE